MVKVSVYDIEGKTTGEVSVETIPDGFVPNKLLISRSLKRQLANARIACAHTLNRRRIHGGGHKPWRQKGTGRARAGSTRSIVWRGGAVAFGPTPARNFTIGMNKRERRAALRQVIWSKIQDGKWVLFEDFELKEPSTKRGRAFIEAVGHEGKVLVVLPEDEKHLNLRKSIRNLPKVTVLTPERLNTFDILNNESILVHKAAFESVRSTWQV